MELIINTIIFSTKAWKKLTIITAKAKTEEYGIKITMSFLVPFQMVFELFVDYLSKLSKMLCTYVPNAKQLNTLVKSSSFITKCTKSRKSRYG